MRDATTGAAQGVRGPDDKGVRQLPCRQIPELRVALDDPAFRHRLADPVHQVAELFPVLGFLDRVEGCSKQANVVFVQNAGPGQFGGQVQPRLPAQRRQKAVRPLPLDHPLGELDGERLDVDAVGDLSVRHDRGGVRIHQHHRAPLLPEGSARLGAGVVKLRRLTDDDRAAANHHDFLNARISGHGSLCSRARWFEKASKIMRKSKNRPILLLLVLLLLLAPLCRCGRLGEN